MNTTIKQVLANVRSAKTTAGAASPRFAKKAKRNKAKPPLTVLPDFKPSAKTIATLNKIAKSYVKDRESDIKQAKDLIERATKQPFMKPPAVESILQELMNDLKFAVQRDSDNVGQWVKQADGTYQLAKGVMLEEYLEEIDADVMNPYASDDIMNELGDYFRRFT